jgi:hypothetical protein
MELAINAENTNMQKYARKAYKDTINTESLVYDQNIRTKMIREMEDKNECLYLTWKIW